MKSFVNCNRCDVRFCKGGVSTDKRGRRHWRNPAWCLGAHTPKPLKTPLIAVAAFNHPESFPEAVHQITSIAHNLKNLEVPLKQYGIK